MSFRSFAFTIVAALALVACGPSAAQVKAARTAQYHASASIVFQAAVGGLKDNKHEVDQADPSSGVALTKGRWFESDGNFVSKDADSKPMVRDGDVVVAFEVAVVAEGQDFRVDVIPHVQQLRSGYSALFEIKVGDPQMPGFISGLVDSIYLSIHGRLKNVAVVAPAT